MKNVITPNRVGIFALIVSATSLLAQFINLTPVWTGYGRDPQHTALSAVAAQPLNRIKWQTAVDENTITGEIGAHYGSVTITPGNLVMVPVRLFGTNSFAIRAIQGNTASGSNPAPAYTLSTDYILPISPDWIPSYSGVLTIRNRFYYPGRGGTVYYVDNPDTHTGNSASGQIAFVGNSNYTANKAVYDSCLKISSPITADRSGNIFFAFRAECSLPGGLTSGIARVSFTGTGSYVTAAAASGGANSVVALNSGPALSNDQRTLYFVTSNGGFNSNGYLASANSTSLAPTARVFLKDPQTGGPASIYDDGSASPMVGPDGDVYYGVVEQYCCDQRNDRGWLLHYSADLATTKIPGGFGWDDTASVIPASAVPGYTGTSKYLLLTKYNNYADFTYGDGRNKVAVIDPFVSQTDPYSPTVQTMKEVMTMLGPTPDTVAHPTKPNAVKEWCINTAAIDPISKAAMVNSEDGVLYWWDFVSGTFTQQIRLTAGVAESYTPTVIGPDGTVYAINDQILFAVGR